MRKRIFCIVLFAMMLIPTTPTSAKQKVKLNKTSVTITKSKMVKLKLQNNKKKIKWLSSNKKIATVSAKGVVKGISNGNTKVIAKIGKKKYSCTVFVGKKVFENKYIKLYYTGIHNRHLTFAVTNKVSHKLEVELSSAAVDGKTLTSSNILDMDSSCSDLKKGQTKKLVYKIFLKNNSYKKLAFTGEIFDLNNGGYTVGGFYKNNVSIGTSASSEWTTPSEKQLIASNYYTDIYYLKSTSKTQKYYITNKSDQGILISTFEFKINGINQTETKDYSNIFIPPKCSAFYTTYYPGSIKSSYAKGIFWICNLSGIILTEPNFNYIIK